MSVSQSVNMSLDDRRTSVSASVHMPAHHTRMPVTCLAAVWVWRRAIAGAVGVGIASAHRRERAAEAGCAALKVRESYLTVNERSAEK